MKKRNLKSLSLNKKSISNLKGLQGGYNTFQQNDDFPSMVGCYTQGEECVPPPPPPTDTSAPSMIVCPTEFTC
jgi:hypothetical protein